MGDIEQITSEIIQQFGFSPSKNWLEGCMTFLLSQPSFPANHDLLMEKIITQILFSDFTTMDITHLYPIVDIFDIGLIESQICLQIVELINIGESSEKRSDISQGFGRCYKMLLTDGSKTFLGFEHRRLPDLSNQSMGAKILVEKALVRRGVLLLSPQNTVVLGGHLEALQSIKDSVDRLGDRMKEGGEKCEEEEEIGRYFAQDVLSSLSLTNLSSLSPSCPNLVRGTLTSFKSFSPRDGGRFNCVVVVEDGYGSGGEGIFKLSDEACEELIGLPSHLVRQQLDEGTRKSAVIKKMAIKCCSSILLLEMKDGGKFIITHVFHNNSTLMNLLSENGMKHEEEEEEEEEEEFK